MKPYRDNVGILAYLLWTLWVPFEVMNGNFEIRENDWRWICSARLSNSSENFRLCCPLLLPSRNLRAFRDLLVTGMTHLDVGAMSSKAMYSLIHVECSRSQEAQFKLIRCSPLRQDSELVFSCSDKLCTWKVNVESQLFNSCRVVHSCQPNFEFYFFKYRSLGERVSSTSLSATTKSKQRA